MSDPGVPPRARIALIGVHGYGQRHLAFLSELHARGTIEFVATADPTGATPGTLPEGVREFSDSTSLFASELAVDIAVIATPIHTHEPLAIEAMRAGADVLVEKPPTSSMAAFHSMVDVAATLGRRVQVGFQSLGSHALDRIAELLQNGELGDLVAVEAVGHWRRDAHYWTRSAWAGKKTLNGHDVVDGAVTNPFAHAVSTALRIADVGNAEELASLELELFHANDIEVDDTSLVALTTTSGLTVTAGFTLCSAENDQTEPRVIVRGSTGTATFFYTLDDLEIAVGDLPTRSEHYGRDDLLLNLLDKRGDDSVELVSELKDLGAFMAVVEAIRVAPQPRQIAPEFVHWHGEGDSRYPVVVDVDEWTERAVAAHSTFSQVGAPWAAPVSAPASAPETLQLGTTTVAIARDGVDVRPESSPRPYLHPVSTLAGIVVSDHHPADHDWHLGVGVAVQVVDGTNFWGGGTYVDGVGYVTGDDHGRIVITDSALEPGVLTQSLGWTDRSGHTVLDETRRMRWSAVNEKTWSLDFGFQLNPAAGRTSVTLESPGSRGFAGSGYGGFFWRLPACSDRTLLSPLGSGEAAVHGEVAPWLAWSAAFDGGDATLLFVPLDDATRSDPWFVRSRDYPGIGMSLAATAPLTLGAGETLARSIRIFVADGRLDAGAIERLVAAPGF
ncbi:DUF6807 family protein [Glaciihabitans sp. UYNi722]|uniref:DUF6807 family protein n=1 Tax=Glaciihabitans sp. UYNi722 TaxID=3156344 RepID=UPI003399D3D7